MSYIKDPALSEYGDESSSSDYALSSMHPDIALRTQEKEKHLDKAQHPEPSMEAFNDKQAPEIAQNDNPPSVTAIFRPLEEIVKASNETEMPFAPYPVAHWPDIFPPPPPTECIDTTPAEGAIFSYSKLTAPTEIRLILLEAEPENRSEVPKCQVVHVDLSSKPLYTAVSYTWGSATDLADISIDGAIFKVRNTVQTALKGLQRTESRLLWIDALCINQRDTEERSQQVTLMGEIFSSANYVVSWIYAPGRKQRSLDHAMGRIKDLVLCEQDLLQVVAEIDVDELEVFFRNDYWSRRWVIQEIAQAGSVVVESVDNAWPISFLEIFFEQLDQLELEVQGSTKEREDTNKPEGGRQKEQKVKQKKRSSRAFDSHSDTPRGVYRRRKSPSSRSSSESRYDSPDGVLSQQAKLESFRNSLATRLQTLRSQRSHHDHTLRELMRTYRYTGCKDFRDTVYALRSLSKKACQHLDVDYTITPFSLLLSVLRFSIEHEGVLSKDVVGLTSLLLEQLELSNESDSSWLDTEECKSANLDLGSASAYVRGHVQQLNISPRMEHYLLRARIGMPSLAQTTFSVFDDEDINEKGSQWFKCENSMTLKSIGASVSAHDLRGFAYGSLQDDNTVAIRIGLASAWVEVDDEVWQFAHSSVAFIARRETTGYKIVATAFLLRPDKSGAYTPSDLTGDEARFLDTADDESALPRAKRHLTLNLRELLTVSAWADRGL